MPLLLSLGIGLSSEQCPAVLEALTSRRTEFTRTPKYGIEAGGGDWRSKKYRAPGNFSLAAEILLAVYFLGAIVFAVEGALLGGSAVSPDLLQRLRLHGLAVALSRLARAPRPCAPRPGARLARSLAWSVVPGRATRGQGVTENRVKVKVVSP